MFCGTAVRRGEKKVRVWNTVTGQCLHTAKLEAAIISVSFHPSGNVLAIASGQFVYLWDYNVSEKNNNQKPNMYVFYATTHRCIKVSLFLCVCNEVPASSATRSIVEYCSSFRGSCVA